MVRNNSRDTQRKDLHTKLAFPLIGSAEYEFSLQHHSITSLMSHPKDHLSMTHYLRLQRDRHTFEHQLLLKHITWKKKVIGKKFSCKNYFTIEFSFLCYQYISLDVTLSQIIHQWPCDVGFKGKYIGTLTIWSPWFGNLWSFKFYSYDYRSFLLAILVY